MAFNYWTNETPEILFNQKYCDYCEGGGMTIECYGGPPLEVRCKECDGDGIIDLTSVELCSEILRVFNDYTGKFGKPLKTENCGGVKSSEFHLADEKEGEYWIAPHYLNKCFLLRYYQKDREIIIHIPMEASDHAEDLEPHILAFLNFFRYKS